MIKLTLETALDVLHRCEFPTSYAYEGAFQFVAEAFGLTTEQLQEKIRGFYRFEWSHEEIADQATFDQFVAEALEIESGVSYEQAARLFYTGTHRTVMVELQVSTKDMVELRGEAEKPWLEAFQVERMGDYDASNEIYSDFGEDKALSFGNAEQMMLALARSLANAPEEEKKDDTKRIRQMTGGKKLFLADFIDEEDGEQYFWYVVATSEEVALQLFTKEANEFCKTYLYYFYERNDEDAEEFLDCFDKHAPILEEGVYDYDGSCLSP